MDVFNFDDTSDLPEALAKELADDGVPQGAKDWTAVLKAGAQAGYPELNIKQLAAAGYRMNLGEVTKQTIRKHIAAAIKAGLVYKPSKTTYALVYSDGETVPEAPAVREGTTLVAITGDHVKSEEVKPELPTANPAKAEKPAEVAVPEEGASQVPDDDPLAALGL